MVREEVEEKGVRDRKVLRALREVPRHLFADSAIDGQAYRGSALPIGWGQTLSQPLVVARMSEALELSGGERVLEVGTGSGYQAAVLARIGCRVYSIERIPELARRSRTLLDSIGVDNVLIRTGDGTLGWREHAPFDRIVITAGAEDVAEALRSQLGDSGILVAPVGGKKQELIVLKRENGTDRIDTIGSCHFVPLISGSRDRLQNVPGGRDGEIA